MDAGRLNQRVAIWTESSVERNVYNEAQPTETLLCTVWAEVSPISQREYLENQRLGSEITTRMRVRYRSDITNAVKAVHGGRTYKVESVIDPQSAHKELVLMCSEAK